MNIPAGTAIKKYPRYTDESINAVFADRLTGKLFLNAELVSDLNCEEMPIKKTKTLQE